MLLSKAVAAVSFLITVFNAISAKPVPGVIRERHVIHAPIKFRIIHHHNIKKVPIIIKKHLHYYKQPQEEIHQRLKPSLVENHPNQIHEDDSDGHYNQFKFYQQKGLPKFKISKIPIQQDDHDIPEEEEYEEPEQSQEEQYEDYEYE